MFSKQGVCMIMRTYKAFIFILLIVSLAAGISFGQTSKSKKKKPVKAKPKKAAKVMEIPPGSAQIQFKVLAEGSYGQISRPFIYVARSKEAYAELQKLIENLPVEVDFSKNAVVAAFAGMKPTGGYDCIFAGYHLKDGVRVSISSLAPLPGRIVTDALTSPFKVALVPVEEEKTVEVAAGAEWKNVAEIYRVTSGNFQFSGGFAFVQKRFDITGTINVWRSGELVTCAFELSARGAEKERKLTETASGIVSQGNSLRIWRLDAGGFVNDPRPPLEAKGRLDAAKLSLEFTSLPTHWSDGFTGRGKLTAAK